jgi:hypothetical protein
MGGLLSDMDTIARRLSHITRRRLSRLSARSNIMDPTGHFRVMATNTMHRHDLTAPPYTGRLLARVERFFFQMSRADY